MEIKTDHIAISDITKEAYVEQYKYSTCLFTQYFMVAGPCASVILANV